jgi:hypothetical protein
MSLAVDSKNSRLKSLFWLFLALICIVFSSASKRLIQQKVNPQLYNSTLSFNKKIKDGCRDRHEYNTRVVRAANEFAPGDTISAVLYLGTLFSFAILFFEHRRAAYVAKEQHLALARVHSLYLRDHRLEV